MPVAETARSRGKSKQSGRRSRLNAITLTSAANTRDASHFSDTQTTHRWGQVHIVGVRSRYDVVVMSLGSGLDIVVMSLGSGLDMMHNAMTLDPIPGAIRATDVVGVRSRYDAQRYDSRPNSRRNPSDRRE